jgi:hypothetical protein
MLPAATCTSTNNGLVEEMPDRPSNGGPVRDTRLGMTVQGVNLGDVP